MNTIKLDYPITIKGEVISKLNIRRPKLRDQISAEKTAVDDAGKEIALFANLCEVTPETLEELDLKDYLKLQKAYNGFLS